MKKSVPQSYRRAGHPARKVFQAIRIAVNDELGRLSAALDTAFSCLNVGGRLAVITFHSLEDRIVKQKFAELAKGCVCPPDFPVCVCGRTPKAKLVFRKPVEPSARELKENPRSRSAKLRCIEKFTIKGEDYMAANRGTEAYDLSLFEPRPAKVVNLKTNKNSRKTAAEKGHTIFSQHPCDHLRCGFCGRGCGNDDCKQD